MTSELKACPFCGGEAQPALCQGGGIEWGQVECVDPECGAVGPTAFATESKAIAAWNTRSSLPNPEGMTEALLFDALKHGDEDHQAWLKDAIAAVFAGEPVPAPRGSGNKEKRIAELEAQVAALSTRSEGQVTEAAKAMVAALRAARNMVPDEEEGLAAQIFAQHLNAAECTLQRALTAERISSRDDGLREVLERAIKQRLDTQEHGGLTEYGEGALAALRALERELSDARE